MNSDFVASKSNIFDIFKFQVEGKIKEDYSSFKVNIPAFQRKYSWVKKDINGLIDELEKIKKSIEKGKITKLNPIYMGHAIFEIKSEEKEIDIIDGQQRLTTFLLLFKILEEIYIEKGLEKECVQEINQLREYLYMKDKNGYNEPRFFHQDINKEIIDQYVYLKGNVDDKDIFDSLIRKKKCKTISKEEKYSKDWFKEKGNREKRDILKEYYDRKRNYIKDSYFNIVTNFDLLEKYLKRDEEHTEKSLNSLVNGLEKLELSYITTKTFKQAYEIFTSLNSKGKPLSDFDLIKSSSINKIREEKIDKPEIFWKEHVESERLSDKEKTNIFEWYMIVNRSKEEINKMNEEEDLKKVYEKVNYFLGKRDIKESLIGIRKYIDIYIKCKEGSFSKNFDGDLLVQEIEDYDNLIEMLFESKYNASKPYIFYLIDKMQHEKKTIENMIDIALWMPLIYISILNNRPESLIKLIDKLKKEGEASTLENKKEFLNKYFKNYISDVDSGILINELSKEHSTNISKYLLMLGEDSSKASKSKAIHLEHIFSQTPNKDLKKELSKNKFFEGEFNEDKYKEKLNLIGNLTLLGYEINKSIKNDLVENKVEDYKKDENKLKTLNTFLKKYVKNKESYFTFDDIDERTKAVAKDFQKLIKEKDLY